MGIARALTTRPISVIGFLVAFHTFIYGVGYILPTSGFEETVLYKNVDGLTTPRVFGWVLLVEGICGMLAFVLQKKWLIGKTSYTQGITWLFVTFIYFLNGDWALGLGIGMVWAILSGYVGYAWANLDYLKQVHLKWLTDLE